MKISISFSTLFIFLKSLGTVELTAATHSLLSNSGKISLACLLLALVSPVFSDLYDGPYYYNDHAYYVLTNVDWQGGEDEAIAMGGHLVAINDAAENDFVTSIFPYTGTFWIGLNDQENEGVWVWSNGDPVIYLNWNPPYEPNGGTSENCVEMGSPSGFWNDLPCDRILAAVIEIICTDADDDNYYYEENCGIERDCNDADPNINPGALQICDGVNNECDHPNWPSLEGTNEFDDDEDGFTECAGDTNDADPDIYPGAVEVCDGKDNNGDGSIDEGCDNICDDPGKIGSDARVTSNNATSWNSTLVWTGSEYGVTWEEYQDADADGTNEEYIYFTRLDSLGNKIISDVLVTMTYPGSIADLPYDRPLVWTGSEYGVTWFDNRDGNYEIYFARLDSSGTKISSDIRITFDSSYFSWFSSLVWTGSEYGVSWGDWRDENFEIYFARLDSSGTKIGSDVRVTYDDSTSDWPSLVWTGSEYGIAWEEYRHGDAEIYFARLDSSGIKISSDLRITTADLHSYNPSLVWTGSEYGVSWMDCRDDNDGDGTLEPEIYFARLDSSGTKIGSDARITYYESLSGWPSLVWTGGEYGVSWYDDWDEGITEIYFARLDSSGTKVGSDVRVTSADGSWSSFPSLIWTGSEYSTSWYDSRDENLEIYFGRIGCCDDSDEDGYSECEGDCNDYDYYVHPQAEEICDEIDNNCDGTIDEGCEEENWGKNGEDEPVTGDDGEDSFYSSMGWNGNEYGVVWEDDRHASSLLALNTEIYFSRLDSTGGMIGDEVRITSADGNSSRPEIVWMDGRYGVAWFDDRDGNGEIYFALLDTIGNKISGDIRITSDAGESSQPSIVYDGTYIGLAWQDNRDYSQPSDYYEIYFARLDSDGNETVQDTRITTVASIKGDPSIGHDGTDYGIVWEDDRDGDFEIYFARVDVNGNELPHPTYGLNDVPITSAAGDSVNPDMEWNGAKYGLVWQDDRPKGPILQGDSDIYYNGIDSIGDKDGDDILLTDDENDSANPNISWRPTPGGTLLQADGEWGVVFADNRDGNWEIYFTNLDPNGIEVSDEVRITEQAEDSLYPRIVWNGEDFGIAWHDLRNEESYELYFARISDCQDYDGDGYTQCEGDCNDDDISINPEAIDICDGIDNDCDGTIDDGDNDLDEVSNCMDNCPDDYNPEQEDFDGDNFGDACDTCMKVPNPDQEPDTTPPSGGITYPPEDSCHDPLSLPLCIQSEFIDNCDISLEIIYDPSQCFDQCGDHCATVTATDSAGNSTSDSVCFTIDTVAPVVQIIEPSFIGLKPLNRLIPFNLVFQSSDDDCASGGIVYEVVYLNNCPIYDGLIYGNGDGLLSDEAIVITTEELCRIATQCGFSNIVKPVIEVKAYDCGGNEGSDSVQVMNLAFKLNPRICP